MKIRILLVTFYLTLLATWLVACAPSPTVLPETETPLPPTLEAPTPPGEVPLEAEDTQQVEIVETETASEPTAEADAVAGMVSELEGLSLAEFFEASNRLLALRSPETVLTLGLEDVYGVTEARLDDISPVFQQETYALVAAILSLLEGYNRTALSPEDQISYDVYHWYLQDRLASQEYMFHDYPATYYPITAVHEDLLNFFTDIHPVSDLQDAQDYVDRLNQVGTKIDQLIEGLERRAQLGIDPPQFAIQWAVYGSLGQFIHEPAPVNRLYTALKQKVDPLSSATPEEWQALLQEAQTAIDEVVLPAFRELHATLSNLQTYPGGDGGIWRLPQGEAYYATLLRHHTTTSISAEEIHQLGLAELERIHAEMRQVFAQLGYPQDLTIVQAYDRVAQDGGHVSGNEVLKTYEQLIVAADQNLEEAFDIRPKTEVIVVPDPYGDYYVHGSFDGTRPGAFYAGVGEAGKDHYAMPTLAYHETVPGHHLQIALAMEMDNLPSFRRGLTFSAFSEGWALYAENLAWELGWYQDDPYGYLGFLQGQAFRAARLVVDTGLHAKGWTFDQAQDFFTENTGFEVGDNVNPQYEIARYMVWPGQSVSYYVGFLKILELRQRAREALGEAFDLTSFHRVVLSNASMPLDVLEEVVAAYIAGEGGS